MSQGVEIKIILGPPTDFLPPHSTRVVVAVAVAAAAAVAVSFSYPLLSPSCSVLL